MQICALMYLGQLSFMQADLYVAYSSGELPISFANQVWSILTNCKCFVCRNENTHNADQQVRFLVYNLEVASRRADESGRSAVAQLSAAHLVL